ncbi:hypothetical protein TNCV_1753661 [Trichonephila clavipes]|nr:hypothetical protein TNCV_1753661 [Trichonephila clavipes]
MLKSASGILTTVPCLDRNSLLLVVLLIRLSTLIRTVSESDRQQKLHPIFEELAKNYGQYWSRYFIQLVRLGQRKQVCLQWIPLHMGVAGNEAADELAGRGYDLPDSSSTVLTHTEIPSF